MFRKFRDIFAEEVFETEAKKRILYSVCISNFLQNGKSKNSFLASSHARAP